MPLGKQQTAINYYMLPFQTMGLTIEDAAANGVTGWTEAEMEGKIADYTDWALEGVTIQNIYGKDYAVVEGVYVIQGEDTLLPETDAVSTNWYNLCNITLRPKATAKGSTKVMIETGAVTNDGVFELILKHKNEYPYTFKDTTTVLYGGHHQIIIGDTAPVNPPVPDKEPGYYAYTEDGGLTVHLKSTTAGSEIFYTVDENVPKFPDDTRYLPYDDLSGISISHTSVIRCYARKMVNGSYKYSYVMDYHYFIEPPAPTLYFADGSKVPYYYYTDANTFTVYGTDRSDHDGNISNIYEIYYTFSPTAEDGTIDPSVAGSDPETGWVKLSKLTRDIAITKSTPVRLVTVRGTSAEDVEFSSVSLYMLYIMPAPVTATPDHNPGYTSPFTVTLATASAKSGAVILFTTDGSDPRSHGITYTGPIQITQNTTIRAVAYMNGIYSVTSAFDYLFDVMPTLAVSAIPYPGEYNETVDVYLTTGNFEDVIHYTTDGSTPNLSSPVYDKTKPIHLTEDTVIRAFAVSADGKNQGDVSSFSYTIVPDAPVIVPSSTQLNEKSKAVTIFKSHPGSDYLLFYTTDGSDPRDAAKRKEFKTGDTLTLNSPTTLRAVYMETVDGISFFGPEAKYIYMLKSSSGGSSGGGGGGRRVVDNTRTYTKDIFGNGHPTHIRSIYGYPDGEFKPKHNLTRAEFAALIRRLAGVETSKDEYPFPDLKESHWSYDDVMSLYSAGYLNGYEDGSIRPENAITRAEVMKVVNIILGRKPMDSYVKSLEVNPFNDLHKDAWHYVIVLEATITHNYYLDDAGVEYKWEDCK